MQAVGSWQAPSWCQRPSEVIACPPAGLTMGREILPIHVHSGQAIGASIWDGKDLHSAVWFSGQHSGEKVDDIDERSLDEWGML